MMGIFERLTMEDIKEILRVIAQTIMSVLEVSEIDYYNLEVDKEEGQVEVEFYQWDRSLQIACTFVSDEVYVEFRDIENVTAEEMGAIEQAIIYTIKSLLEE